MATLYELELAIERCERTQLDAGRALTVIRDKHLYRPAFKSFEAYIKTRWGWTRQRAYQLIAYARQAAETSTTVDKLSPRNERQARAEATHTKTSTPINWYGGKNRMAPTLVKLLPSHHRYIEPFFGGGSVLFAKAAAEIEIVSDINHHVVTFFKTLRDNANELAQRLRLTPYSREEHRRALDTKPTGDEIEDARRFFVRTRQSFSGVDGGTWAIGYEKSKADDTANAVNRLHETAERLRRVQIESRPFQHILPKCDLDETVIYCDPPYVQAARTRHGAAYRHEMTDSDHANLLGILTAYSRAKVILSGYRSPLYDEELKKWNRRDIDTIKMAGMGDGRRTISTECVWTNF